MDKWITLVVALGSLLASAVSLYITLKKSSHETEKMDAEKVKTEAETNNIHAQTADRWAEHVQELMDEIAQMKAEREIDREELKGLRLDIAHISGLA